MTKGKLRLLLCLQYTGIVGYVYLIFFFANLNFILILICTIEENSTKPSDQNDNERRGGNLCEAGPDPSAPITRRGILTSLLSGKPMEIPEQDIVCNELFLFNYLTVKIN